MTSLSGDVNVASAVPYSLLVPVCGGATCAYVGVCKAAMNKVIRLITRFFMLSCSLTLDVSYLYPNSGCSSVFFSYRIEWR